MPPFFVFAGKKSTKKSLMESCPPGSECHFRKTRWMTSEAFLKWLTHFVNFSKPSKDNPVLLVLDVHCSHKSLSVLQYAKYNSIIMLSLPTAYSKAVENLLRQKDRKNVLDKDIAGFVDTGRFRK